MERRVFLARTATAVSATLVMGSVWSDRYRFVGSALAAGNGDGQKTALEQKFAEFADISGRVDVRPNWKEQPTGASLTGKQWR